jgi:hypothetical protein
MAIQIIINQAGPLPITATFASPSDATTNLEIYGSVWSQSANNMIGISIDLDGKKVGMAQIFSNGTATHRAVVPVYIPISVGQGNHTLKLYQSTPQTVSDFNDVFCAVLHY